MFDEKINLSIFDKRYTNDQTGATAIEPRILLKIILYCYSCGVISSRKIAATCRSHLVVKALAETIEPHYTTMSNFVSGMGEKIQRVFSEVVLVCHELKLIQGNLFALDGCWLPSNASKEWSGTRSELGKKHERIQKMLGALPEQHRQADSGGLDEGEQRKLRRLDQAARRGTGQIERDGQ
jgi:transposase